MAVHRRRRAATPAWTPLSVHLHTKVIIVGKPKFTVGKILLGHFWCRVQTPPYLSLRSPLPISCTEVPFSKVFGVPQRRPLPRTVSQYYHEVAYKSSDIDLFIYGLTEEEGKQKLLEIYFAICEKTMPLVHTIAFRCVPPLRPRSNTRPTPFPDKIPRGAGRAQGFIV